MNVVFLVNTISSWDEPERARHQFTYALACYYPIIFITKNKFGINRFVESKPKENITVIEPHFPVSSKIRYRFPLINEMYQCWLFSRLQKKYGKTIFTVNFDFSATLISRYFANTIYYCNDEFSGNYKYSNVLMDKYIKECEKRVIRSSRFCIATSKYLTEKLKTNNSNTFEIPLGSSVQIPDYNHPQPFKQNEIITAAILGFINERQISIELINRIIESKKLQLVLIGSVEPSFKNKLSNIQRVKMTGELKGSALWAELTKIDVGLALYNLKQINPGNTSNKLWQYLLAGKPVVISDLPNLRDMDFPEKSVYRFSDDNKLLDTILLAVNEDSEKSYFERKDFAKQNSWDVRVNQFLGIFRNYFPF